MEASIEESSYPRQSCADLVYSSNGNMCRVWCNVLIISRLACALLSLNRQITVYCLNISTSQQTRQQALLPSFVCTIVIYVSKVR